VATSALFAATQSCSESLRALGPSPTVAEAHADQLFEAFIARFSQVEFSPQYDAARVKLAQSALVPSRIFNDDAVWSSKPSASSRLLYIAGDAVDGHYRLESRPTMSALTRPGESRHTITLEQLEGSAYRWDTKVDLGVGTVPAEGVSVLISTLLAAPDGRSERELRDDYRAAFPRAMAAFGRGFSIDSLHVAPGAAGTTSVTMVMAFHPELMRSSYPALAAYLDKYLGPAKYHFALADRSGAALFDVVGRDRSATVKYRLQQGKLTSLFGPPRPWADSLVMTSDVSLKVKVFTVGFHGLLTDFVVSNVGHERAWTVVAQHEPKWDLPFITERLLRAPLRKPFEGAGSLFRLSVRDSAGGQTVFTRRTRLDVQESAIMRFVGSLASRAMGDLDNKVEQDEHRFLRDGFAALQADLHAVRTRWRPESENATSVEARGVH
jgi:hypothetical protein